MSIDPNLAKENKVPVDIIMGAGSVADLRIDSDPN